MSMKPLIEKIFNEGNKQGMEDMEVYYVGGRNLDLKSFQRELEGYSLSESEGLSFRGTYKGKMGYSYTEKVDDTSIQMLIKEAIENSQINDSCDEEVIFEGSLAYEAENNYNSELEKVEEIDKIKFIKVLEEKAYELDRRIVAVQGCMYGDGYDERIIANNKGLYLHKESNLAYVYLSVVAKEGEEIKTGVAYRAVRDFKNLNAEEIAAEAIKEAVSMFGASTIKSADYKIVLRNNTASDLLGAFSEMFSGEKVQKNLSLLKGKINEKIASDKLTIVDDALMEGGLASSSFDGEGAACKYKKVIENGVLKTYLHNLKTSKNEGVETTGNASKPSYKSPVGIAPSNFFIEKGEKTFEEIIQSVQKGVLVTDLQGLHSGLNPVSGDFSLAAAGYEIESGKIKRPIDQITLSGNFLEMLQNIEEVGTDLRFGLPREAYIGSPTIKIKKLAVAGD